MKYCRFCGNEMDDADRFCAKCGQAVWESQPYHHSPPPAPVHVEKEPKEKLFCELAYSGFLFWLPLVFCKEEKYARQSANQGLWALITAVVLCAAVKIAGAVSTFFASTIFGVFFSLFHSLSFAVFLVCMLCLTWKCVKNALRIHNGEELDPFLFFDRAAIIR